MITKPVSKRMRYYGIKTTLCFRHIWVVAILLTVSYCCFADMVRLPRLGSWECLGPYIWHGDKPIRYDIDLRGRLLKLDYLKQKVEIIARIPIERCAPYTDIEGWFDPDTSFVYLLVAKTFPTLYTYDIGTLTLTKTNLHFKTDTYLVTAPVSKNVLYCQEGLLKEERKTLSLDLRTGKQHYLPYLDFCHALPSLSSETDDLFVVRNLISEDNSFEGLPDPIIFCVDASSGTLKYKKNMVRLKNLCSE